MAEERGIEPHTYRRTTCLAGSSEPSPVYLPIRFIKKSL